MNEQSIINDSIRYVLDLLEKVNYYPYHNINHTLDVYSRCDYLCDKEFVRLQDKTDVLLAALFHDTWFTIDYFKNEMLWVKIAQEYLNSINFDKDRIINVSNIIAATIVGTKPKNKLEQIIQDADFDNLGRKDCLVKTINLKKELYLATGNKIDLLDWFKWSYNLIRNHNYNTPTAIIERNEWKEHNLKRLEERINMIESSLNLK